MAAEVMGARASRLFHSIVVVGASLGCGGGSHVSTGFAGAAPGAPAEGEPDAGRSPAQPVVAPAGDGGPAGVCDCARPGTFRCSHCSSDVGPIDGRCPNGDGVDCVCDPTVKIAAPRDCAHPEQFTCALAPGVDAAIGPTNGFGATDWYAFADCACNASVPLDAGQCADAGEVLRCESFDPCAPGTAGRDAFAGVEYACACVPAVVPIAQ
jgi:hypothetical protein